MNEKKKDAPMTLLERLGGAEKQVEPKPTSRLSPKKKAAPKKVVESADVEEEGDETMTIQGLKAKNEKVFAEIGIVQKIIVRRGKVQIKPPSQPQPFLTLLLDLLLTFLRKLRFTSLW